MITTEETAKAKRCCVDLQRDCVGSACMAWRWAAFDKTYAEVIFGTSKARAEETIAHPPTGKPENWMLVGHCGRASHL